MLDASLGHGGKVLSPVISSGLKCGDSGTERTPLLLTGHHFVTYQDDQDRHSGRLSVCQRNLIHFKANSLATDEVISLG